MTTVNKKANQIPEYTKEVKNVAAMIKSLASGSGWKVFSKSRNPEEISKNKADKIASEADALITRIENNPISPDDHFIIGASYIELIYHWDESLRPVRKRPKYGRPERIDEAIDLFLRDLEDDPHKKTTARVESCAKKMKVSKSTFWSYLKERSEKGA